MSCSAALALAQGQSGTATVSIKAQDPYGQTNSAAATVQEAAAPGGSGGGGGAFDLWTLLALGGVLTLRGRVKEGMDETYLRGIGPDAGRRSERTTVAATSG